MSARAATNSKKLGEVFPEALITISGSVRFKQIIFKKLLQVLQEFFTMYLIVVFHQMLCL